MIEKEGKRNVGKKEENTMIEKTLKQKKTLSIVMQMFIVLSLLVIVIAPISANNVTEELIGDKSGFYASNSTSHVADDTSQIQLYDKIDSLLESDNKPVFLYFYSELCGFCEKQKPLVEELRNEYSDNISFVFVDTEDPSFDLSGFDIYGYPTMMIIHDPEKNLDGQYVNVKPFRGLTEKKKLDCAIESSLNGGTADYLSQPFISEPVFVGHISKSNFGKYNAISTNWTVLADNVQSYSQDSYEYDHGLGEPYIPLPTKIDPFMIGSDNFSSSTSETSVGIRSIDPYCCDFMEDLSSNQDINYYLETIAIGPYCANNWHMNDCDGDGYVEGYLLVGETYYQWSFGRAPSTSGHYITNFGPYSLLDPVHENGYGCTDSSGASSPLKANCDSRIEYSWQSKQLTSPSSRLSSIQMFVFGADSAGYWGSWGWHGWDLYWTSGGHTEYAMVLECGVDSDCPGGQICCKPTLSNPTSYYCAAPLSAPTLSAPSDACADTSYTISWNSVSGATSYKLYENGNNVYEGAELSRQYSHSSGSYTYYVQACNDCGCSGNSNSKTVSIKQKPSAPTLSAPDDACADTSYTVSWNSVSGATSYKLYENGNNAYDGSELSRQYSHPSGSYTYYVQACNDCGCSGNSNSKTVSIKQKPSTPTLSAPSDACSDTSYTVSWTSVPGATSYKLYENGNNVYDGSELSRQYSHSSGSYTYYVQACNDCGCSGNSNSKTVEIKQKPDACFTTNPNPPEGCVPLTVEFDASCSSGEIASYSWDFGDDETGTGETLSHQYEEVDEYTVTLTVSGPCGSDTATKTVHVGDCVPFTNITIGSATVALGDTTTLDVMINNVTNAGAVDLNLTYNPAVVQVTAASNGDFDVTTKNLVHSADGYIRIIAYQSGEEGLNGNVLITTLTLEAMGVGTSVLDLSGTKLSDNTPQQVNINVELINGTFITIPGAPPFIVSFAPESPVKDYEGAKRTFNITINQIVNVSWQINGTEVQTNESVTEAVYTNTSAAIGTWNVSAVASNPNGTDMQTWIWNVTEAPRGNDWGIKLDVTSGAGADVAEFGLNATATDVFDAEFDVPEPPSPPPPYLQAYFYYPENPLIKNLDASYIPHHEVEGAEWNSWPLRVDYRGDASDVTITWNATDIAAVPQNYSLFFVVDGGWIDMNTTPSYTFSATTGTYEFEIIAVTAVPYTFVLSAGWNMISFPGEPLDNDADTIFGPEYYYLYTWNPDTGCYVPVDAVETEIGYWLLVLENRNVTVLGTQISEYNTDLAQGWNMIGSLWTATNVPDGTETVPTDQMYPYIYAWCGDHYALTQDIEPGLGYWALAYVDCELHVFPASSAAPLPVQQITWGDNDWHVRLALTSGAGTDVAEFGLHEDATDEFSAELDVPEPPSPPPSSTSPYLQVYFYNLENPLVKKLSTCYIPHHFVDDDEEYNSWLFSVDYSGDASDVTVTWNAEDINAVPVEYSLLFIADGEQIDMRTTPSYTFRAKTRTYEFEIRALTGGKQPDLVIEDSYEKGKAGSYIVLFVVKNIGTATAPGGHYAMLYVDGVEKDKKLVPTDLEPGETYKGSFKTKVGLTGKVENIKVCADSYNDVDELDEDNNCLKGRWQPVAEKPTTDKPPADKPPTDKPPKEKEAGLGD